VVLNEDKTKTQKSSPFQEITNANKSFETFKIYGTVKLIITNNKIEFLK
jgi:hypothetical protein